MALGATSWAVDEDVRIAAARTKRVAPCSWNTYQGHGLPPAKGQRRTVDFWDPPGRGAPLREASGDAICSWLLGQHEVKPLLIVIWYGWIWLPGQGWLPYGGFQGSHGPGADSHVHVGFA